LLLHLSGRRQKLVVREFSKVIHKNNAHPELHVLGHTAAAEETFLKLWLFLDLPKWEAQVRSILLTLVVLTTPTHVLRGKAVARSATICADKERISSGSQPSSFNTSKYPATT
jgi:hypothetical protein